MNQKVKDDISSDEIKESLFCYIKINEEKFSKLISERKFKEIINDISKNIISKINDIESLAVLATGTLHYILTKSLIPSQRKIVINGIDVDIVIPNIKTLKSNPKDALVIYIPKVMNENLINSEISQLNKIQPEKRNIWVILSKDIKFENKYYTLNHSFSNILYDIEKFVNKNNKNTFKIMGN